VCSVSQSSLSKSKLTEYSVHLQLAFVPSPYRVIRPLVLPHKSKRFLKVLTRNGGRRTNALKVRASALPWRLQRVLTLCGTGERNRDATTIRVDMLPHDVLLEIFVFYRDGDCYRLVWQWHILLHVCQRWRQVVFASPLHLDLRVFCTDGTPVRKNLGIWPPFPIML
jgi:hypothetical protein